MKMEYYKEVYGNAKIIIKVSTISESGLTTFKKDVTI
jgi:hypothetical protein